MLYLILGIILVLYFDFIGFSYVTNKKFGSTLFGFLLVVTINLPIALLSKYLDFSFSTYCILMIIISSFMFIYSFKGNIRDWVKSYKAIHYIYILIFVIIATLLALSANNLSDSWLYLKLILFPISTNSIEVQEVVNTHAYDTFYLLQSFYTKISFLDPYTFILFTLTFVNSFIILSAISYFYAIILENVGVPEYKKYFLILIPILALFFNFYYVSMVYFKDSILFFIINVVSSGTLFLYGISVPYLMLTYIYRTRSFEKSLIIISGFAFTYSFIYIYVIFIAIYIISGFFTKEYEDIRFYSLFLNMMPLFIFLNLNISFLVLIILQFATIIFYFTCSSLKRIYTIVPFVFVGFNILWISKNYGIVSFIKQAISPDRNSYIAGEVSFVYPELSEFWPLYILYAITMFFIFKYNKRIFVILIVPIVFFGNYISLFTIGDILSQSIYHRVYLFNLIGPITMVGILWVFTKYYSFRYYFMVPLILFFFSITPNFFQRIEFEDYRNSKIGNDDVLMLESFDFSKSKVIDTNTDYKSETENGIFQILQLKPELIYSTNCTSQCYEVVYTEDYVPDNVELTLTNDKYLIYRE